MSSETPPTPDEFKLLEKEVYRHGFTYRQLERTASCALYAVQTKSGGTLGYEVIKIKIAPAVFMKINNTWVPERETYPGDEEFGERGWYFMNPQEKEKAHSRYLKIKMEASEA